MLKKALQNKQLDRLQSFCVETGRVQDWVKIERALQTTNESPINEFRQISSVINDASQAFAQFEKIFGLGHSLLPVSECDSAVDECYFDDGGDTDDDEPELAVCMLQLTIKASGGAIFTMVADVNGSASDLLKLLSRNTDPQINFKFRTLVSGTDINPEKPLSLQGVTGNTLIEFVPRLRAGAPPKPPKGGSPSVKGFFKTLTSEERQTQLDKQTEVTKSQMCAAATKSQRQHAEDDIELGKRMRMEHVTRESLNAVCLRSHPQT